MDGTHRPVVVVGGGQAGLSMSYCLGQRGIDHLVLERRRVGHEWRERRWDSFCLVTPNWQCQLPGFPYSGGDPDGFMSRDEVVRYLEDYAASFRPPVVEGVAATRLAPGPAGGFEITTTGGDLTADHVVLATGPYQIPRIPRLAERLPDGLTQLPSSSYRAPDQLPPGEVLVVGSGQSGCQIAEDLHLAGRRVHLSVGGAPRIARRYRGRDVVAWLDAMGYYDRTVGELPDADDLRTRANHYVTGRDGGRDIDLRALARDGMRLYGRLSAATGGRLRFAADLRQRLDHADRVAENVKDSIDAFISSRDLSAPAEARYTPVWEPTDTPAELDLERAGISAVVWSTGFGRDHRWIEVPVFDGRGYPVHDRGVTSWPGLYVLGMPWQYTWGSGRFSGVGRDAAYLAEHVAQHVTRHVTQHICSAGPRTSAAEVRWLAGTPDSTYPDDDWVAPRTVA